MDKELEMAKRAWRDFLEAHPDADMTAAVETIVSGTQDITFRAVGEWLALHWISRSTDDVGTYELLISDFEPLLEALKRGEMPE